MSYASTQTEPSRNRAREAMGATAVTSAYALDPRPAHYVYRDGVKLYSRDKDILDGVGSYGAMTTAQIAEIYFDGLKSKTSWQNVLSRLVRNGALARVFVNLPDKPQGGSPTGCYQIGRKSWKSIYPGTPFREVRDQYKLMHTLMMVDTYIEVLRLSRAGFFEIEHHEVEAEAWRPYDGGETHPDISLILDLVRRKRYMNMYLEVDRSREFEYQIQQKVRRFVSAASERKSYPRVVFVVERGKDKRVRALRRYIAGVDGVPDGMFYVFTIDDFREQLKAWSMG